MHFVTIGYTAKEFLFSIHFCLVCFALMWRVLKKITRVSETREKYSDDNVYD